MLYLYRVFESGFEEILTMAYTFLKNPEQYFITKIPMATSHISAKSAKYCDP